MAVWLGQVADRRRGARGVRTAARPAAALPQLVAVGLSVQSRVAPRLRSPKVGVELLVGRAVDASATSRSTRLDASGALTVIVLPLASEIRACANPGLLSSSVSDARVLRVQPEHLPDELGALRAEVVVVGEPARPGQVDGVLDVVHRGLRPGRVAGVVEGVLLAEVELVGDLVVHPEAVRLGQVGRSSGTTLASPPSRLNSAW